MNPDDTQNQQPQQDTMPQPPVSEPGAQGQQGDSAGMPEGDATKPEVQGDAPNVPEGDAPKPEGEVGGEAPGASVPGSDDEQDGGKW